jgi:hypothetical protein
VDKDDVSTRIVPVQKAFSLFTRRSDDRPIHGLRLSVARRQGADLYELRAALDDFELRGEPARAALDDVVGRFAADNPLLERQRYLSGLASSKPQLE